MKLLRICIFIVSLLAWSSSSNAQKIKSYNADSLIARTSHSDTVYVVNFWATWCVPCVKELPAFNIVNDLYKGKAVKVLLLSFDFADSYPETLHQWVSKKKLRPEVVWFSETNPTEYIPRIAPEWEGGLPATIFINNKTGERKFIAEEVSVEDMKAWLDKQNL